MRKVFRVFMIACLALLTGSGCAREKRPDGYDRSFLENLPFVYRMTVQQGNILTEDIVDSLEPGMTKAQVSFLLGTPLLTDFFHSDRWDYPYTIQRGHQPMEKRFLTLYFQNDALARIEGDFRPDAKRSASREPREIVVSVPDYRERTGLLKKGLQSLGLKPEE